MSTTEPQVETAKIITISIEHIHPDTINFLDTSGGDLVEGPSIAVRNEGYLMNSHRGVDTALEHDFLGTDDHPALIETFPDLVLIRSLARGLGAEWINIDVDGVIYADILPVYNDDGEITPPTGEGWKDALSQTGLSANGVEMITPSREVLEMIEAGQTPSLGMIGDLAP